MPQDAFTILGLIRDIETIAFGRGVREIANLNRMFGRARWRKKKGMATIQFANGVVARAELHWYEAHGIGKRKMKIKQFWIE
jgi:hypothetical protein